ncbi:hypothetical protein [Streptomyces sp. NPDC053560]|uniref:hypothetical protein n=1 Tax=Streptomyces sp. NPDC053560 TaxID=3365711 RepID=UPI0037D7C2C7
MRVRTAVTATVLSALVVLGAAGAAAAAPPPSTASDTSSATDAAEDAGTPLINLSDVPVLSYNGVNKS